MTGLHWDLLGPSIDRGQVLEGLSAWQSRPLGPVYPVIFIDAVNVKIRDGQVVNRPIYVALAVTFDGTRDILGLREKATEKRLGGHSRPPRHASFKNHATQ